MTIEQGASGVRAGGSLPLPRPPGVVRRFGLRHPRAVDWALAVGAQLTAAVVGIVLLAVDETQRLTGVALTLAAIVAGGALLWRRRRPLTVTIVCAVLLAIPAAGAAGAFLAIYVALYSLGAYSTTARAWIGVGIATAASMASTLVMALIEPPPIAPIVSLNALGLASFAVAVLLGSSVRGRRAYVAALIARADDMARERDQQAQLAVAAERARIAREMHDVVSHGLTVMVTLAEGSAAQAERDPARASATMRRVADAGRDSLAEMRRLLGVLREPGDGTDRAPQPSAGDLHALVASFRDAGVHARLTTSGPVIADHTLALTVHRIVQEALTNVMRHASDAEHVVVAVHHGDDEVRITIVDDGSGTAATTTGAGRGLVGVRERAAMFAGTVEAGPRAPQGWRLAARLTVPTPSASADASAEPLAPPSADQPELP